MTRSKATQTEQFSAIIQSLESAYVAIGDEHTSRISEALSAFVSEIADYCEKQDVRIYTAIDDVVKIIQLRQEVALSALAPHEPVTLADAIRTAQENSRAADRELFRNSIRS